MSSIENARRRRQLRRSVVTAAVLVTGLLLILLWVPVANSYHGAVDGNAVSTHRLGILSWATISWWGPAGSLFWPVERLDPVIHWNRFLWTLLATALLCGPLIWFRVRLVRRSGRRWVELRSRSTL